MVRDRVRELVPIGDAIVYGLNEFIVSGVSFIVRSDDERERVLGSVYEVELAMLDALDDRMSGQVRERRVAQVDGVLEFVDLYILSDRSILAGSWDVEKMSMSLP
jgi:gamma-glutamylcyclotransferase (GGCT)/AIG2-like uncharacterized protein YtfP